MILNMAQYTGMNFRVEAGSAEPANPIENTLWAVTDTAAPGWTIRALEPDASEEGMVWFVLGSEGGLSFNALNTNELILPVVGCRQYLSAVWEEKPVKLYRGGSWEELAVTE